MLLYIINAFVINSHSHVIYSFRKLILLRSTGTMHLSIQLAISLLFLYSRYKNHYLKSKLLKVTKAVPQVQSSKHSYKNRFHSLITLLALAFALMALTKLLTIKLYKYT